MGGLVAGAFAAGLTPAEMREAMAKADWADMFQDNPAFYDMSYRNKRLSQTVPAGRPSSGSPPRACSTRRAS